MNDINRLRILSNYGFVPRNVLDIGANRGEWTLSVKNIFPNARYICIDANQKYEKYYIDNNLEYKIFLLGNEQKIIDFYINPDSSGGGDSIFRENTWVYYENNIKVEKCKMDILDNCINSYQLDSVDLMKIDTQGSELLILDGANEVLKITEFIILEVSIIRYNESGPIFDEVIKYMSNKGFCVFDIIEHHYFDNVCIQVDVMFLNLKSKFTTIMAKKLSEKTDLRLYNIYENNKRCELNMIDSIYNTDVIIGTYSNSLLKYTKLLNSAKKYYPNIPFIFHYDDKNISDNIEELRKKFIKSKKRFWIYVDDDAQFVNSTLIPNSIKTLLSNSYAGVGCHDCITDKWIKEPYDIQKLKSYDSPWMVGWFMAIDSKKVGDIDLIRYTPERTSIDIHYSFDIRMRGYKVGVTPDYLYHEPKKEKKSKNDKELFITNTREYFCNKFSKKFYDENCYVQCVRLYDYDCADIYKKMPSKFTEDELRWIGYNGMWHFSILDINSDLNSSFQMLSNTSGNIYSITDLDNRNFEFDIARHKILKTHDDAVSFFNKNSIKFDMIWINDENFNKIENIISMYKPFFEKEYTIAGYGISKNNKNVLTNIIDSYNIVNGGNIWFLNV